MKRKEWTDNPPRKPKAIPSGLTKIKVQEKTDELAFTVLKPAYVQSSPENPKYNYVKDIYFNPYLSEISPTFDSGFARMEYAGENQFNLSSMWYSGQWHEIYSELSLDECLTD